MKQLIILLVIIVIIAIFANRSVEPLENKHHENRERVLYPTKGLQGECAKLGYKPAYMPSSCIKKNGYFNNHRNCKCRDDEGYCAVCYPEIKHEGLTGNTGSGSEDNRFGGVVQKN